MTIEIVHCPSPQTIWAPIEAAATVYVGGLVGLDTGAPAEGVIMMPDAVGKANDTNKDMILGVVIGTNRLYPLWDSSHKRNKIACPGPLDPHDGASIDYFGDRGVYPVGDQVAMVKIAIIGPSTVLRAPIYNAEVGVAPTVVTVTTGDTSGVTATVGEIDFTPEANNYTNAAMYWRTGNNAGTYRDMDSTGSKTAMKWDQATTRAVSASPGDTMVAVPLRTFGPSTVTFGTTTMAWIDASAAPVLNGDNRWSIFVYRLDLTTATKEYAEFRFDAAHFGAYFAGN